MMANLVTLLRTLLCLIAIGLLFMPTPVTYWAAFVLTVLVILMDALDGYLARMLNESSRFGALADILADRIVEQVYWISFLALGWIPLWVPLVVIVRGVLVDGLRSLAQAEGHTAFGKTTMMQSRLGVILVSSRASRWLYAFFKALAFSLMILVYMPGETPSPVLSMAAYTSLYATLFFCVVRGLPVVLESRRFLRAESEST